MQRGQILKNAAVYCMLSAEGEGFLSFFAMYFLRHFKLSVCAFQHLDTGHQREHAALRQQKQLNAKVTVYYLF